MSDHAAVEAAVASWALDTPGGPPTVAEVGAELRRRSPLLDPVTLGAISHRIVVGLTGLGPLEGLLADPEVTEIMVNGPGPVWVERSGEVMRSGEVVDAVTLQRVVERIVAPLGRRLDRTSPLVDGRLSDGSRVHVAVAPVALDGPYLTIRRFRPSPFRLRDLAAPQVADLLDGAVASRCNIVVSGATGSGKTTLLNALAACVDRGERVVTIEDAAELRLEAPHVVRLEARPAAVDGPPPVRIRDLVRAALRMRPDRIVVGEVRGDETLDMVQAMHTGHDGSLSTVHANGPADALRRLTSMILMEGSIASATLASDVVGAAVDLVVHTARGDGGARRVVMVAEPHGEHRVRTIATGDRVVAERVRRRDELP